MKYLVLFAIMLASTLLVREARAATSLSAVYCESGRGVLEGQSFYLREIEMPIEVARNSFDYLLKQNSDAWLFMIESVAILYQNPEKMRTALSDGSWDSLCLKRVRGY